MAVAWNGVQAVPATKFTCGYCGRDVASDRGYFGHVDNVAYAAVIYICPYCEQPSYFRQGGQVPGVAYGNDVGALPDDIAALYREARASCSVSAYTASVLTCRKILINIAVAQGAEENLRFIEYVEYLAANHYVPPNGLGWVDHIRLKGNEATHEIELMSVEDAHELISFVEMLLKFIYEFPARVPAAP